ncbi:hypothetical protein ACFORL_11715 [Legionella dresdenensis]|uniref:Uncharacterized protein n=1 Tax=Legionella dresdenensis TaxID=450200 RepID=A0ABV8CHM9_9GAMM
MNNLFHNHPSFIEADNIKQLCEPLHLLDITTFSHLRVSNTNQLTVQCNNPVFLANYLTKNTTRPIHALI